MTNAVPAPPTDPPNTRDGSRVWEIRESHESFPWDRFEFQKHEVNETNESQAPATRTLNRERRHPGWHSDYVMKSNVAYCLLTEEGEPSTLQEALNNPDASF
ncbi:hypothetical protein Tco_1288203 [Tanacetum coccineum]